MFQAFYDYLYNILFNFSGTIVENFDFSIGGNSVDLAQYICISIAILLCGIIFVLCALFIWKIVKVVARLFTGA